MTTKVPAAMVAADVTAKNAGDIVQVVATQTGAVSTGTTLIPGDDTIPQITEGTEFMTRAITPTSATNYLEIEAVVQIANGATNTALLIAALFQDSTANALAAAFIYTAINASGQIVVRHRMLAGTTSATTFRVRVGPSAANTITFNGGASARLLGGVLASSITITEIKA